jgi:hypothetical protein
MMRVCKICSLASRLLSLMTGSMIAYRPTVVVNAHDVTVSCLYSPKTLMIAAVAYQAQSI